MGFVLAEIFSRPVLNIVEADPYGLIEMSGGVGVGLGGAFLGRGPASLGCGFSGAVGLCGV